MLEQGENKVNRKISNYSDVVPFNYFTGVFRKLWSILGTWFQKHYFVTYTGKFCNFIITFLVKFVLLLYNFKLFQLFTASLLTLMIDGLLSKGYGLGSGFSLFVTTQTCTEIFNKMFSPRTTNSGKGNLNSIVQISILFFVSERCNV